MILQVQENQITDSAFVDLVLRQRGEIPADAVGLGLFNGGHGEVRIDGKAIGIFSSAVGGPVFDISAYAGKEVSLEFAF